MVDNLKVASALNAAAAAHSSSSHLSPSLCPSNNPKKKRCMQTYLKDISTNSECAAAERTDASPSAPSLPSYCKISDNGNRQSNHMMNIAQPCIGHCHEDLVGSGKTAKKSERRGKSERISYANRSGVVTNLVNRVDQAIFSDWNWFFVEVERDYTIPTMSFILPVHSSLLKTRRVMVQVRV